MGPNSKDEGCDYRTDDAIENNIAMTKQQMTMNELLKDDQYRAMDQLRRPYPTSSEEFKSISDAMVERRRELTTKMSGVSIPASEHSVPSTWMTKEELIAQSGVSNITGVVKCDCGWLKRSDIPMRSHSTWCKKRVAFVKSGGEL